MHSWFNTDILYLFLDILSYTSISDITIADVRKSLRLRSVSIYSSACFLESRMWLMITLRDKMIVQKLHEKETNLIERNI